MNASAAVDAVYNLLKTVPGVGPNVYPQIRYTSDDAKFRELFLDAVTDPAAPIVRTWMVSRESSSAIEPFIQTWKATHNVVITGFMACVDGGSEPIWQAQIDAICTVLGALSARQYDNQFDWSGPPQVEGVKLVFFGSVLCHTVRIIHPVQEFPLD